MRVFPRPRNVTLSLITKKPKDSHSRHVVEVREAIQKVDPTIPSTQSPSQHFIWVSSKKSCPVGGLGGEYASVVTEYSDQNAEEVTQVEENLEIPDLQIKGEELKLPRNITKTNHQFPAAKHLLSPWITSLTTAVEHPGSLEVQVAKRKTKNPAKKMKRKRRTREELDEKQAAAAQRRMVCQSMHTSPTVCILFQASYTPTTTIIFIA